MERGLRVQLEHKTPDHRLRAPVVSGAPPVDKGPAIDGCTTHALPANAHALLVGVHRMIFVAPPPLALALPGTRALAEKAGALKTTLRWLVAELDALGPVAYPAIRGLDLVLDLLPNSSAFPQL
jgi:hypothetical protein